MGGGAWPFLVGGAICQANPDNERDFSGRGATITAMWLWRLSQMDRQQNCRKSEVITGL